MEAKTKLRTSEDVYKRLKQDLQWDEDWAGEEEVWIGYRDGIFGPMEQRFSAFVPIGDGGDIPFTRVYYFRRAEAIIWDRLRRWDTLWQSGETTSILAAQRGQKVNGFNVQEDRRLADETATAVMQAKETLARLEDERQVNMVEQQKRKRRQQEMQSRRLERQLKQQEPGDELDCAAEKAPVVCMGELEAPHRAGIRIATWNVLNDDHVEERQPLSEARLPELVEMLRAADPDIIALQEVTAAVLPAFRASWPHRLWFADVPGTQLAVLSRHPIIQAVSISLGPNTSKRALLVEVVVERRSVAVVNVHFTSDRRGSETVDNSAKRAWQAKAVRAALAKRMAHADAFICGDFNEPSAERVEAAAEQMDGLVDAWLSVHGEELPGFTFDPTRNWLADLGSLVKAPRRLDRIFACPRWLPHAAALLGEDVSASDHFGLMASFTTRSAEPVKPVHTSAVVLLPPAALWEQIDAIRRRFDPSFGRWMPHINLLYGFLPESLFGEAEVAMDVVMRRQQVLELTLAKFAIFEHGRSASLVLVPTCTPDGGIVALQRALQALFPTCTEQSARELGFQPHLTVGNFSSFDDARRCRAELERDWTPLTFVVSEVALIARSGGSPFEVRTSVPLCSAMGCRDLQLLEALEAKSGGARAFAIGSSALLGAERPAASDLDVLLVGPGKRDEVFQRLSTAMQASWVRHAEAQFPVLQMEVDGIPLDIQYACSSCSRHPLLWRGGECDEGGHASDALRDMHLLKRLVLGAVGLAGWRRYQLGLLAVKKWAKQRQICSNALGYLGGFSWSLLLAATVLAEGGEVDGDNPEGSVLVALMCRRYVEWRWPDPVVLGDAGEAVACAPESDACMPVMCLADRSRNSAKNVTHSTRAVLLAELRLAASGNTSTPIFGDYEVFVRCQVRVQGPRRPVCSAWLQARLLFLVRSLDHLSVRPLKVADGLWAFGVKSEALAAEACAERFRVRLDRDLPEEAWRGLIDVEVEGRDALRQAMPRRS